MPFIWAAVIVLVASPRDVQAQVAGTNKGATDRAQLNVLQSLRRVDLVPSPRKPASVNDPLRRFAVGIETALAQEAPIAEVSALAAANQFPGAVPSKAPRGEHTVTINTAVPGWHSLGLYAAPGEKISVTLPRTALSLNLVVQIGSHTDELWHLDSWERIPHVVRRFSITETHTTAASSLGGLITIDVPGGGKSQKTEITGKNLGPFFQAWGVPTSERARVSIENFPHWMPTGFKSK